MRKITIVLIGVLFLVLAPTSIGGGFLGDLINRHVPGVGKELDDAHQNQSAVRDRAAAKDNVVLPAFATQCEITAVGVCYLRTIETLPPGQPCKCVFENGRSLAGFTR